MNDVPLPRQILEHYRNIVAAAHPNMVAAWPLLGGHNATIGTYKGWMIFAFTHTGANSMTSYNGIGEMDRAIVGVDTIDTLTWPMVQHSNVAKFFNFKMMDGVLLLSPAKNIAPEELNALLLRHEIALGLAPMKIFLSHKGVDKPMVREFYYALEALGFQVWLDEDAMAAGTKLDRGIREGLEKSCAAIFFITPSFVDEKWLADEIDYAIEEKRSKSEGLLSSTSSFPDNSSATKGYPKIVDDAFHIEGTKDAARSPAGGSQSTADCSWFSAFQEEEPRFLMSPIGTSRHFAAAKQFGRFRVEADICPRSCDSNHFTRWT